MPTFVASYLHRWSVTCSKAGAGAMWDLPGKSSWYSRLVYLGDHISEGTSIPMLTFTCPPEHLEKHPFNVPNRAYASTILAGLVEAAGMTPAAAVAYIRHAGTVHRRRLLHGHSAGHTISKWVDDPAAVADAVAHWLEPGSPHLSAFSVWAASTVEAVPILEGRHP